MGSVPGARPSLPLAPQITATNRPPALPGVTLTAALSDREFDFEGRAFVDGVGDGDLAVVFRDRGLNVR